MKQETIETLAGKYLGRSISSSDHYDPSLLNPIPRQENRDKYDISYDHLPFIGWDSWHCYELSFLNKNGLPINVVMKLVYSSSNDFIIESKSLKLYLNSFNMYVSQYESIEEVKEEVKSIIENDLSSALQTTVYVHLHNSFEVGSMNEDYFDLDMYGEGLNSVVCENFNETPSLLTSSVVSNPNSTVGEPRKNMKITWSGLRSNCRVTHQPDFGNVYIWYENAEKESSIENIVKYLVSFRNENHFHEEVVEMIFQRILTELKPEKLMVGALYTRRGGIDICPIRATHEDMLSENWCNEKVFIKENGRQ